MPETLNHTSFLNTGKNINTSGSISSSNSTRNRPCKAEHTKFSGVGILGSACSSSSSSSIKSANKKNSSYILASINKHFSKNNSNTTNSDPPKSCNSSSLIKDLIGNSSKKKSNTSLSSSSKSAGSKEEEGGVDDEFADLFLVSATTFTNNKNPTPTPSSATNTATPFTQSTFLLPSCSSFTSSTTTTPSTITNTTLTTTTTTNTVPVVTSLQSSSFKKTSDFFKSTYGLTSDTTTNSNSNIQAHTSLNQQIPTNTSSKSDNLIHTNTNTTTYSPVTPIGGGTGGGGCGAGDLGSANLTSNSDSSSISSSSSSSSSSSTTSLVGNFYFKNSKKNTIGKEKKSPVSPSLGSKFKSTMIIDVFNRLYGTTANVNAHSNAATDQTPTQLYPLKNKSQSLLAVVATPTNTGAQGNKLVHANKFLIQPYLNKNSVDTQKQQLVRNDLKKTFNNFYLLNVASSPSSSSGFVKKPFIQNDRDAQSSDINIYSAKYNINLFNAQIADKNNNCLNNHVDTAFLLKQPAKISSLLENNVVKSSDGVAMSTLTQEQEQECVSFNNEAVILTQTDDLNVKEDKDQTWVIVNRPIQILTFAMAMLIQCITLRKNSDN